MQAELENGLPGLEDGISRLKAFGLLALMVAVNGFAFVTSFGAGVIVTLPLTIFFAFLLLRDSVPKHRLPSNTFPL